jgi:hypothetical protein
MDKNFRAIHRNQNLAAEIARDMAAIAEVLAKAREALALPIPDTFLGRQRHAMIPRPDEEGPP